MSVINVYVTFSALMLSVGWHEGHQPVISTAATAQQCCWLMTTCWQHAVYKSGMLSQKGWSLGAGGQSSPCNHYNLSDHHDSMLAAYCLQSWTLSWTLLVEWQVGHADISQHTCGLTDSPITHSQISVDDVVSWRHPKSKIPEIHRTATTKLTKQRTGPKYKSIRCKKRIESARCDKKPGTGW